ncbi:SsgA family sporulation/cell division regulator [Nonomuraea guangzhouensis]|uniref:SsgA family sporulation/cell division regulator n=1 Tax=Nonomuraea guangzhouensis TaxID=1291555 RepID=A0ABW4GYU4_9ACTN|nr:SsgA family sporulation/cell division regulator [Nonomuraea guangzhouensis]
MTNYVHQPFTLWATGTELNVHAGFLAYGIDAPAMVELVFPLHDGSGEVTSYTVPRELLAAGLQHCASWRGFTVRPDDRPDWLVVTLPGLGDFYADAVVVLQFLDHTAELVPMEVAA